MRPRAALAVVAVASGLLGCAHGKIEKTSIDDTPENREILKLVDAYHHALEARDAAAITSMLSPRYYEDSGNTDSGDDYDLAQLRKGLGSEFQLTKALQLNMRVDEIDVQEDKAYAYVFYTIRAQTEFPSGLKWKTASDRARFEFELRDGRWLMIAGL